MDFTTLLILAYFALLAVKLFKPWGVVDGPWLFFFRAFFPNWKFYHGITRAPRLYVRGQSANRTWSDWFLVYPRLPRQSGHLFHNPAVNLALAHQNLIDHLASDIQDLPEGGDIGQRVTYQLVNQLALLALTGGRWGDQAMIAQPFQSLAAYQFELRMELPHGQNSHVMLQSPVVPT